MRYFIKLSYHGKYYHGWQIQKTSISVEEVLEKSLSILLKIPINIIGAGRTDSGVHAKQMFAHFDFNGIIENNFIKRLNNFLPKSIKVFQIYKVKNNAHARFNAISRTYKYFISLGKNPLYIDFVYYYLYESLSIKKMNEASAILMKYNNFKSFCKSNGENKNFNCKIYKAYWTQKKNILCFTIKSNRFLRNMVRTIIGTLINVGRGKINIDNFINIIESKNRQRAGDSVPATGLFLIKICYPKDIFL